MARSIQTLNVLKEGLNTGKFSSVEITQDYLDNINSNNALSNSFISITDNLALAQAKRADEAIAAGQAGGLTGLPIAHKDIFCTDGVKTSCGSKMLDNFIAPYNATVVEQLSQAGIVTLGKTNMDEFAMGSTSANSYYGAVNNPWDLACVPGGSSGGSAACIAAGLAPAATGTDTGGSIRQPAALCGITGLKPTYGRVSRYGMIAFASSLDQGGPMAHTAEDCALLMQGMAGFDPKDSTSIERAVPDYSAHLKDSIAGLKIGLPKQYFADGLEPEVAKVIEEAIAQYAKMGATLKDISLPNTHLSVPVYYIVATAECSSNLSRLDGVRYGYRAKNPKDLEDLYKRSRGEAFGEEVKRRILVGTYALSAGYYDAYYVKAQQLRRLISQDFSAAFKDIDVIMGPVYPEVAFKASEKSSDPVSMYLSDIYTLGVNLAGLPGMSVPAGFAHNKPVGLQLIGNYFSEAKLLNIAYQYQQASDWHLQASPLNVGGEK